MENRNYRKLITLLLIFTNGICFSQTVLSLDYLLKYDSATCWYDVHIIILDGYAEGVAQRSQFYSNITLVIPTGTTLVIEEKYMPLQNNQSYSGNVPNEWNVDSSVSDPASSPGNDFIAIVPTFSPSSQYNNIYALDTIKLFSVSVSGGSNCGEGVRIYENGVDPSSSDEGMQGGNYSNEFKIGGVSELYNGNAPLEGPKPPGILELTDNSGVNVDINLETSGASCQGSIEYMWTGPNGYISTSEDVLIDPATSVDFGEYEVIVIDSIGCADTASIIIEEYVPTVRILGSLDINNAYVLPYIGGSANQVLTTDGNGIVSWMDVPTSLVGGDSPTDNRWVDAKNISIDSRREIDNLKNDVLILKSEIEALKVLIEKLTND